MIKIIKVESNLIGVIQNVQLKVIDASNNGDKFLRRPISKILLFIKNEIDGSISM